MQCGISCKHSLKNIRNHQLRRAVERLLLAEGYYYHAVMQYGISCKHLLKNHRDHQLTRALKRVLLLLS